jgi:hypothetical protein
MDVFKLPNNFLKQDYCPQLKGHVIAQLSNMSKLIISRIKVHKQLSFTIKFVLPLGIQPPVLC